VSTTERPLEAGRPSLFGTAPRQDRAVSRRQARDAAERAASHLLSLQHPEGYWKGELETNVTMDAEDLLLREFLGISTPRVTQATARWIRSKQRSDGTWASFYEGPGELSTTVEAYVALRLAGDSPTDPHLAKAAAFIQSEGGLEATRVFTRLWLALFGLWSWDELPSIPPELIALPLSVPFNIYDFACWARQTIVALAVVACYQPVRPLSFSIEELHATGTNRARRPLLHPGTPFELADGLLRHYGRVARGTSPFSQSREAALAACERWIIRRQEADGSWGGIQPPWVYSIIALHLRGYPLDHPVLAGALAGLESFVIEENGMRRLEACQSPVWDTAFAVIGLADAGIASDHPALLRAAEWLVGEEVRVKGDWAVRRPDLAPGGWSFEFENDNYPDIDDTAEVIRLAAAMYEAMGMDANGTTWRRSAADQLASRLGDEVMVFVVDDPTTPGRLAATGAGSIATRLPGPGNPDAKVGYIQWVSTDPAWRRRGPARSITAALLKWFADRAVGSVELHATRAGEPMYRALNFNEGPNPALRMRLEPPAPGAR
jgi:squalene-hopene/tetraprenyl-beta-curcumene cyclase